MSRTGSLFSKVSSVIPAKAGIQFGCRLRAFFARTTTHLGIEFKSKSARSVPGIQLLGTLCLVGLVLPASAASFHDRLSEANDLLKQGLFDKAVPALEEMKVDYPDQPVLDYALASAQYQRGLGLGAAGKADEATSALRDAVTRFGGISEHADTRIAMAAAFGRANALAQQAQLLAAPDKYKEALAALRDAEAAYLDVLKRDPAYPGAQKNLDHIRLALKQLLQNPPQQPPQDKQQQPPPDKEPPKPQPRLVSVFHGASTQIQGATAVADGATVTLKGGNAAAPAPSGGQP